MQNLALAQLAAAIVDGFGGVVTQSQQAGSMGGGGRLTIGQCQNRANLALATTNRGGQMRSGLLGLVEMKRDRTVGPGIVELMAAIAANDDSKARAAVRLRQSYAFGSPACSQARGECAGLLLSNASNRLAKRSQKKASDCVVGRLACEPMADELIVGRLGAAIPWFAEVRNPVGVERSQAQRDQGWRLRPPIQWRRARSA